MYSTILITGGAGFVGSYLAIAFKKDYPKSKVIVLDNLKRRGSELNLPRLRESGVEFLHGDIRNIEDFELEVPIELLVECSAEPSVLAGYSSSLSYLINTNLVGTINCLELARKNQSDVLFLSTSRVYPFKTISALSYQETSTRFELIEQQTVSGTSSFGISEDFPLTGSRSFYGTTKLASELVLQEYIEMYNLRGIINRCGVLTGPWQMGKIDQGVVVHWAARHIFGGDLAYFGYGGTGKQVRDILHIEDLYDLIKIQMDNINDHAGNVYNVGGGRETSLSLFELTRLCEKISGNVLSIGSISETRQGDIPIYISDCSKLYNATGWKPKHNSEEIVSEIIKWIRDNQESLHPILS